MLNKKTLVQVGPVLTFQMKDICGYVSSHRGLSASHPYWRELSRHFFGMETTSVDLLLQLPAKIQFSDWRPLKNVIIQDYKHHFTLFVHGDIKHEGFTHTCVQKHSSLDTLDCWAGCGSLLSSLGELQRSMEDYGIYLSFLLQTGPRCCACHNHSKVLTGTGTDFWFSRAENWSTLTTSSTRQREGAVCLASILHSGIGNCCSVV